MSREQLAGEILQDFTEASENIEVMAEPPTDMLLFGLALFCVYLVSMSIKRRFK